MHHVPIYRPTSYDARRADGVGELLSLVDEVLDEVVRRRQTAFSRRRRPRQRRTEHDRQVVSGHLIHAARRRHSVHNTLHLCTQPHCEYVSKKGKRFPYSTPSVGPGADPGVQAVSLQVTVKSSTRR